MHTHGFVNNFFIFFEHFRAASIMRGKIASFLAQKSARGQLPQLFF